MIIIFHVSYLHAWTGAPQSLQNLVIFLDDAVGANRVNMENASSA